MKWLVFSKDRPYQLDAFIRTASENARIDLGDISVLHHYTNDFVSDLQTLKSEHPRVEFLEQNDFRDDVLSWVNRNDSSTISFATDDALFTRKVPAKIIEEILLNNPNVITFALRMGLHLEHCYPTNSPQRIPNGMIQRGVFVWSANEAEGDWGYPLSVDGHVFIREHIRNMFKEFDFNNPNSLESNWQAIRQHVSPLACCLPKSCYFNVPLNRVQSAYANRTGNVSHESLARVYRDGSRYDSRMCSNILNVSAHEEINIA